MAPAKNTRIEYKTADEETATVVLAGELTAGQIERIRFASFCGAGLDDVIAPFGLPRPAPGTVAQVVEAALTDDPPSVTRGSAADLYRRALPSFMRQVLAYGVNGDFSALDGLLDEITGGRPSGELLSVAPDRFARGGPDRERVASAFAGLFEPAAAASALLSDQRLSLIDTDGVATAAKSVSASFAPAVDSGLRVIGKEPITVGEVRSARVDLGRFAAAVRLMVDAASRAV
jgi:hypothetical protein